MASPRGLSEFNTALLQDTLAYLKAFDGKWITTANLSIEGSVAPKDIRNVLEWHRQNGNSPEVQRMKRSARVVEWRLVDAEPEGTAWDGPEVLVLSNVTEHRHDGLIESLGDVLGENEKYRQTLMKIREMITQAIGG